MEKIIYDFGLQREGDHIWWITNISKAKLHYLNWDVRISLKEIFREIYNFLVEHGLNKSNTSVVEVTHITEIYGPAEALENYLKQNYNEFLIIAHPLHISSLNNSIYKIHANGELQNINRYRIFKSSEVISYLQHFLLTLYILMKTKRKFNIYIGVDNLNAFAGILLKAFGLVNKVVFYVIDYTPRRFKSKSLNAIYYILDVICARYADNIWSVSERIANLWKRLGIEGRKSVVVPIGIEIKEIKRVPLSSVRKNVLVFVGHLTRSKGVQLAIEAMEEITKKFADIRLEIIGTGPFERELKEIVRRKKLEKWVNFLGKMQHKKLMQYLPTCGIALATYEPDPSSITYYADPTKPKEYLACGLPVIITRVPWIAREIEEKPMGIAINYDKYELINAITKLILDYDFYETCRRNAAEFTFKLDWNRIFDKAFANLR